MKEPLTYNHSVPLATYLFSNKITLKTNNSPWKATCDRISPADREMSFQPLFGCTIKPEFGLSAKN